MKGGNAGGPGHLIICQAVFIVQKRACVFKGFCVYRLLFASEKLTFAPVTRFRITTKFQEKISVFFKMNVNADELCESAEFRRQAGKVFLSCRVIKFLYLMLAATNDCFEKTLMRHMPYSVIKLLNSLWFFYTQVRNKIARA